ncbi:MAG: molybdenum cofactor guanylyltransferase, partial [Candidatus Nanopelagicales bacterium]
LHREAEAGVGSQAAIVIAGGEGRRFGADKLALRDAQGMGLLEATIASLGEVAEPIIVVGPERPVARDVIWAREDPPGGGPCAALIAGVAHVPEGVTHVAVLAGDAPTGGRAIPALRQVIDDAAAAVVTDSAGREQPMTAVYAVRPLREALASYGDGRDMSVRQVLGDLRAQTVVTIIDQWGASADIDVPEDADRLGFS